MRQGLRKCSNCWRLLGMTLGNGRREMKGAKARVLENRLFDIDRYIMQWAMQIGGRGKLDAMHGGRCACRSAREMGWDACKREAAALYARNVRCM